MAAYTIEVADDGKSMSAIRLAVAAIVDALRRVGLESPQTAGVSETLPEVQVTQPTAAR